MAIQLIQKVSCGNALRLTLAPPPGAVSWRILRRSADDFSGCDDPGAYVAYQGNEKSIVDMYGLFNGEQVFYRAYYRVGSDWVSSASVIATPEATFSDLSVDALVVVRDRLELGLKVYVDRGLITHARNFIPVMTASPQVEDVNFPMVTVHLGNDSPDIRSIGEVISSDVFSGDDGMWHSFEGGYSRTDLTIVGWCLNGDERIVLRNALKAVLNANLPVFDAAGLLQVTWNFSDVEDFERYAAPVYQAICNFSCYAPSAVDSVDFAIRDVLLNPIF